MALLSIIISTSPEEKPIYILSFTHAQQNNCWPTRSTAWNFPSVILLRVTVTKHVIYVIYVYVCYNQIFYSENIMHAKEKLNGSDVIHTIYRQILYV